jgi:hypothetical protein
MILIVGRWMLAAACVAAALAVSGPAPADYEDWATEKEEDWSEFLNRDEEKPEPKPPEDLEAVVIPLTGDIMYQRTTKYLADAVTEARKNRPEYIIFEVSSDGGRIDVAQDMAAVVLDIKDARTIAFVTGSEGGAYSAAAFFAAACDEIYMAPGQVIGAAVAFTTAKEGVPKAVQEKFDSAWRGKFRAVAESNGHPTALIGAMVSPKEGVAEVKVGGATKYVAATSVDEAERLAKASGEGFEVVRTICPPGKVLTLTSKEAVDTGLAAAELEDTDALFLKLRIDPGETRRLKDPLAHSLTDIKELQKWMDRRVQGFTRSLSKAAENDPARFTYTVYRNRQFADGGRQWRRQSKKCLRAVRSCLRELDYIRKKAEEDPDVNVDLKALAAWRAQLQGLRERVKANENLRHLPK